MDKVLIFICVFCGKSFKIEKKFLLHLLKVHKYTNPKSRYIKEFPDSDLAKVPDKRIGRKKSKEELQKCSRLGFKHSDKTKQEMSKTRKGRQAWNKGLKNTFTHTEDYKQMMSKQQCKLLSERKNKETSIERKIRLLLQNLDIDFYPQDIIKCFVVDFYIPQANLIIECFGDYWHNRDDIKKKDVRKLKSLEKNHNLLILWEHEINDNIEKCKKKIVEALCRNQDLILKVENI